jgi:t-SNARE complex subunit (syntaxin)
MEKESQKVIDDIESQVTATRQELDEGGGANFQTMQSSRAAGLWWPPWWFQLIIVILLIFAGVLGQVSYHSPSL